MSWRGEGISLSNSSGFLPPELKDLGFISMARPPELRPEGRAFSSPAFYSGLFPSFLNILNGPRRESIAQIDYGIAGESAEDRGAYLLGPSGLVHTELLNSIQLATTLHDLSRRRALPRLLDPTGL